MNIPGSTGFGIVRTDFACKATETTVWPLYPSFPFPPISYLAISCNYFNINDEISGTGYNWLTSNLIRNFDMTPYCIFHFSISFSLHFLCLFLSSSFLCFFLLSCFTWLKEIYFITKMLRTLIMACHQHQMRPLKYSESGPRMQLHILKGKILYPNDTLIITSPFSYFYKIVSLFSSCSSTSSSSSSFLIFETPMGVLVWAKRSILETS